MSKQLVEELEKEIMEGLGSYLPKKVRVCKLYENGKKEAIRERELKERYKLNNDDEVIFEFSECCISKYFEKIENKTLFRVRYKSHAYLSERIDEALLIAVAIVNENSDLSYAASKLLLKEVTK